MPINDLLDTLNWKSELLSTIIWCLLAGIGFVVSYLLIYQTSRKREVARKDEINRKFQLLVEKALFFEPEEGETGNEIIIPPKFEKFMRKEVYRDFLLQQIVDTRKYISGIAADHLEELYLQLNLHNYSLKKMNSRKWYIKAQGIQELALMNQTQFAEAIQPYTNHKNSYVRLEAQAAMVRLFQFKGLDFLGATSYTMSDWEQMKVMEQLPKKPPQETAAIKEWLQSTNQSVVLFAMRLIYNYRLYQLHDELAACLSHPVQFIREKGAKFLGNIYNETTSALIIRRFNLESKRYQLEALNTLCLIGDEKNIPFLYQKLSDTDYDIKLAAAKAILESIEDGRALIAQHPAAGTYPLNSILAEFKAEQAA